MEIYNGLGFEKMTEKDIAVMARIMKRAFDEDARRHLGEECTSTVRSAAYHGSSADMV